MENNDSKKFIMVLCDGFVKYTYMDLRIDNRVKVFNSTLKDTNNKFLTLLKKLHTGKRVDEVIHLPFKHIWGYSLDEINWRTDKEYYIIFAEPYPLKTKYLKALKQKYNIKYILYACFVWDNQTHYSAMQRKYAAEINYDYIFSFDPDGALKYGFIYFPIPYSMLQNNTSCSIEYDLYLVANASTRGRLPIFHNIYRYLHDKDLSMHYRLTGVSKKKQEFKDTIIYNKTIEYPDVIDGVKKSNCILEVLANGQSGATLRYYEAVCYNKKLLTNNKNVVNLPFYNPEYIHVFEKPEDIDCKWVKERIPVDYGYDGRFSPSRLIDRIIELEEEKEG